MRDRTDSETESTLGMVIDNNLKITNTDIKSYIKSYDEWVHQRKITTIVEKDL